jgi:hypothetical protein
MESPRRSDVSRLAGSSGGTDIPTRFDEGGVNANVVPEARATAWLRVRHVSAVLALMLAPVAGIAWSWLVPLFTGSMADEVAAVASGPTRFVLGTYLGVVMSFLMVPATLALGRLVRPHAPVVGDLATALCVVGAWAHGGVLAFQLAETAVIAAVPDRVQAVGIVEQLFQHRAFLLILAPFVAFYAGLVIFSLILLVRRVVAPWVPMLIVVAIAIELAGPWMWKARLFFVMLAVAFAALAHAVWRVGPVEWARRDETSRTARVTAE